MKKTKIIAITLLLILLCSCTEGSDKKPNYEITRSKVEIWSNPEGTNYIILAVEATNLSLFPLHFKESDFDIVDEKGTLIETMKSVNAYPPDVNPNKKVVYYNVKKTDKVFDNSIKLKAIPHIENKISMLNDAELAVIGITTGGSTYASGTLSNSSFVTKYHNVNIAIVSRKSNDEIVSVMTALIDSIKPGEKIEFEATDSLIGRTTGTNIVTKFQIFVYIRK